MGDGDPAPLPSSSDEVLNLKQFADLIGSDDPEAIRDIMGFFVESFTQSLASVRESLAAQDRAALRQAAHAAKGAARNACASVLATELDDLERQSVTSEPFARLGERMAAIETAFVHVQDAITRLSA